MRRNLTKEEFYQLRKVVAEFNNTEGYFVSITENLDFTKDYVIKSFQINWSSIGSVDEEKAKEFIQQLNQAVDLIHTLNSKLEKPRKNK